MSLVLIWSWTLASICLLLPIVGSDQIVRERISSWQWQTVKQRCLKDIPRKGKNYDWKDVRSEAVCTKRHQQGWVIVPVLKPRGKLWRKDLRQCVSTSPTPTYICFWYLFQRMDTFQKIPHQLNSTWHNTTNPSKLKNAKEKRKGWQQILQKYSRPSMLRAGWQKAVG